MSDIKHLIELLRSENPNKRYDACEELRISRQPLPPEAIDALNIAINDTNPDVADAAQRALAMHMPQLNSIGKNINTALQDQKAIEPPLTNWRAIKIGMLIGLVPTVLVFVFYSIVLHPFYGLIFILVTLAPLAIPGGLVGGLIGYQLKKTRGATVGGAILGTILVSIIVFFYLLKFGSPFGVPQ